MIHLVSQTGSSISMARRCRIGCRKQRKIQMTTLQKSAQNQLRQFVEQIENLEEQKKALSDDIRDKFLEAKAVGFDVKALRQIVRMRKKSSDERKEEQSIIDVYLHALGMTPMEEYLDEIDSKPSRSLNDEIAAGPFGA